MPPPLRPQDSEDKYAKKEAQEEAQGLTGDYTAIALLMLLYTLQGVPMGLAGSVPMLMQASGKSDDSDQAKFSFASWPFSFKLLWAPIVDSLFIAKFGRRKTWIVPAQALIGALMLYTGRRVDGMLGAGDNELEVKTLTAIFFTFFFLAATQDIAVDGLALTILSERNKELGATCNAVGQSLGYFLAYTVFLAFNSKEFCNAYLRASPGDAGLFTLGDFMTFWGWLFVASCFAVVLVKKDEYSLGAAATPLGAVTEAYGQMVTVLKLPSVQQLILVLLTCRVGTGVDSAVGIRLMKHGVPTEHLALIASLAMPVTMVAQAYVTYRYFGGNDSKPMSVWLTNFPARIFTVVVSIAVVYATQTAGAGTDGLPTWLYALMVVATVVSSIVSSTMFVSLMAFFNRVSDPTIGGTYMTMLNTFANLGGNWPGTAALFAINAATTDWLDGFYPVGVLSAVLGGAWLLAMASRVRQIENLPASAWLAAKSPEAEPSSTISTDLSEEEVAEEEP